MKTPVIVHSISICPMDILNQNAISLNSLTKQKLRSVEEFYSQGSFGERHMAEFRCFVCLECASIICNGLFFAPQQKNREKNEKDSERKGE